MKTLITHFTNDAHLYPDNPHKEIIERLQKENIFADTTYVSLVPTFTFCRNWLSHLEYNWDNILMFGGTHRPSNIYLEIYGRNQYADPNTEKIKLIDEKGQNLYKTKLDLKTLISKMTSNRHINISTNAGTHVCNYIYYRNLERTQNIDSKVLFTHVSGGFENWKFDAIKEIISLILGIKTAKKKKRTEDIIDEVTWNVPEDKDETPIDNVIGDVPMHWHF
jgi:pyrrolidone-carboxylate peptidase